MHLHRYLAEDIILKGDPQNKLSKKELKELFIYATAKTHFIFNGKFYDQVDGIAMGSPLAPTLANLFMGTFEIKFLNKFRDIGPSFYKRYVDDIFCVFNEPSQAKEFLNKLNIEHPNIKFTLELEKNNRISYLTR